MSLKLNERYPGRFNNPSADYPSGSFKNRTTPDSKDGSYLEKDWANDKEGFFQSILSAAGIDANGSVDKVGASQFFDSLQKLKQNQIGTAFTSTGPSAALVLTPTPAISSYSAGQRFRVKFNRASTGTDTINISGVGAKPLKQYDASGAKVSAVFAIDQLSDVEFDGTDIVLLDQLPAASNNVIGIMGLAKNLKASASGTSSAISVTADEILLENPSNTYQVVRSVSVSPSLASSGAGGLDTGASAASTWYSVWVIWNGTTVAGLFSLSATAPTMPVGYTHKARVGWIRTDSSANKYPLSFIQSGRRVQYKVVAGSNLAALPIMASGSAGSVSAPKWVPVVVSNYVPTTASRIISIMCGGSSNSLFIAAPNNAYGGYQSTTNPPPVLTNGAQQSLFIEMVLEGSSIYYASTSGAYALVVCFGWEDSI